MNDIEPIFNAALERGDPAARSAYLDEVCGDDGVLRGRLEALLKAHRSIGGFLDEPIQVAGETVDASTSGIAISEGPGTVIDRYKLLQQIGEGGFGLVYMAEQIEPVSRKVALKIIKLGMDTKQVIARFEAERQALALMDHPNIARVFDGGMTESGRPYFVMELVKGIPITEYCRRNGLSTRERLELFIEVCRAVQHAHQKGIIHRDIKPNNVLVTLHDSRPVPKVIDFGIAKATSRRLTDKTLFTEFRQFIGTPEYMSPDQADISGLDVDTRTDIYSLGVLLYELLTGTTPFDSKTLRKAAYEEVQRIIREVDPPKPSTRVATLAAEGSGKVPPGVSDLSNRIRGDLDWIVMRALEKDRTRRYDTANEFASDILRHLNDEPVLAGPPSVFYRVRKFVRRHRVGVAAGGVTIAALLIGLSLATVGFIQATEARDAFERERDVATRARDDAQEAQKSERRQRELAELNAEIARQEAAKAEAVAEFIRGMLSSVDPSKVRGRDVKMRYVLDEAVAWLAEGALADQPEVEASVRMTIGETYEALGLYEDAEGQLRQAIELSEHERGADDPETLRARGAVGVVLRYRGKFRAAEAMLRDTLSRQKAVLGEHHVDTLVTMDNLGVTLWRQGKFAEGEAAHREALAAMDRVLGPEHEISLRCRVNLGAVLWYLKRKDEALAHQRDTLALLRKVLGDEHPQTLRALNNFSLLLGDLGMLDEAEALHRQSLELHRRVFGDRHPNTTHAIANLGDFLLSRGKMWEAEAYIKEGYELYRDLLGRQHPTTRWSLISMQGLYRLQRRWDELRPYAMEDLESRRIAAEGPDADADLMNSYAWALLTCLPPDLRDAERAVEVAERAVEVSNAENGVVLDTLAVAYEATGRIDKAIEAQERAVAVGGETPLRSNFEQRLAGLYWSKGQYVAAMRIQQRSLARGMERLAADDVTAGDSLFRGARTLVFQGNFSGAEPLLRHCLELRRNALEPGDERTAEALGLLGKTLAGMGRFDEAEQLLLEACAHIVGENEQLTDKAEVVVRQLIEMYVAWGRPDAADEWKGKLGTVGGILTTSESTHCEDALAEDSPCIHCGYNLRGLALEGNCPECFTPLSLSLRGDLLRYADQDWLARIRFGATLKLWSVLAFFCTLGPVIVAHFAGLPQGQDVLLFLPARLFGLWTVFVITAQEPRLTLQEEKVDVRVAARVAALVDLAGVLLHIVAASLIKSHIAFDIVQVLGLAGIVVVLAEMVYLARIAMRIPNEILARSARIVGWGSAGVMLLAAIVGRLAASMGVAGAAPPSSAIQLILVLGGCFIIVPGVFLGIWYIILLFQYRAALLGAIVAGRNCGAPADSAEAPENQKP